MSWLYRYEAKSIQRWILTTDRLIELRGGSSLIEDLQEHARRALGANLCYAGAGSATARFDTREELERFAQLWPMFVTRHAPGLDLVQAWSQDDLPELRTRLGVARNRLPAELPEAGPWVARAGRSGLPAVGRDESGGLLDAGTRARARAGRDPDRLGDLVLESLAHLPDRPPHGVRFQTELLRYPEDEGIAVVHADGNGIGQRIHGMDLKQLTAFSQQLSAASRSAAQRATAELVRFEASQPDPRHDDDGRLVIHGRPVVAGGDDFTFLVRGRAGIALAEAWLRGFEQATAAAGIPLSACAGVVFVRRGFPFHQAHEAAERLCKGAKLARRQNGDASRLQFERVTTTLHQDDDTGSSWSLAELRQLTALLDASLRIDARGKLRAWTAERDAERAREQWRRLAEVATPDAWRGFESALAPFQERRAAVRAVLQWSRIHPGRGQDRLWRET